MGRSKFPGKPPKTVTRKRIKVLAWPEATQSDSITVAENIYYGLSLFNETFGDNEKVIRASLSICRAYTAQIIMNASCQFPVICLTIVFR